MSETAVPKLELGRVGDSVPRVDGIPKVIGEFAYSSDLQAAGMLWGHTVRSPHAHARIVPVAVAHRGAVRMERLLLRRRFRVDDRLEWLVLDANTLGRAARLLRMFGGYERNRFSEVTHALVGKDGLVL